MDRVSIIFKAIELIPRFLPRPKPPTIDYGPLYEALPKPQLPQLSATEIKIKTEPSQIAEAEPGTEEGISTRYRVIKPIVQGLDANAIIAAVMGVVVSDLKWP